MQFLASLSTKYVEDAEFVIIMLVRGKLCGMHHPETTVWVWQNFKIVLLICGIRS